VIDAIFIMSFDADERGEVHGHLFVIFRGLCLGALRACVLLGLGLGELGYTKVIRPVMNIP
jgi:hypothetical protein